jgi:hypothetical protein
MARTKRQTMLRRHHNSLPPSTAQAVEAKEKVIDWQYFHVIGGRLF